MKRIIIFLIACAVFFSVASPPHVLAATYYVAPNLNPNGSTNNVGNDANSGTQTQPWKTFDRAWTTVRAGDTLILLDGTYTQTLQPRVSGTAGAPITTKAEHDGQVIIDGQNQRKTVVLGTWGGDPGGLYHVLEGIVAKNSTGAVYHISGSNNQLRRVSGYNANTDENNHVYTIVDGTNNIVEDCIAAGSGRKMAFAYNATYITYRRCVAYWQQWDGRNMVEEWPWGNGFEMYNSSYGTMENVIALGGYNDQALNILSNMDTTSSPNGADNNKLLGSIVLNNGVFPDGSIMRWGMTKPQPSVSHLLREWWNWGHVESVGITTWGSNAVVQNSFIQDVFSWNGMGPGIGSFAFNASSTPINTQINRVTVLNNRQDPETSPHLRGPVGTDIITNTTTHLTITNSRIGKGYNTSTGQTITNPYTGEGARLAHRYQNGVLQDGTGGTTAQPLWPWSMQDRLIKETGIDITGDTTDVLLANQTATGKTLAAPGISPKPPEGNPLKNISGVTYLNPVTVTLTLPTGATSIRYTTDGSTPTSSSALYSGPFAVNTTTLVKAVAFNSSGQAGHQRSAYYLINPSTQNQPPEVTADLEPFIYPHLEIVLPKNQAKLYATAADYTLPTGGSIVTTNWSTLQAPAGGNVTFTNATKPRTTATFSAAGKYILRLTASDGQLSTTKDVTVQVWPVDMAGVTHTIPGRLDAENYKAGGEGVGYHQTHSYGDVRYRNSPVSRVDAMYAYNDDWGYSIEDLNPGEWVAYNVNITQPGPYNVTLRYSGQGIGGSFQLTLEPASPVPNVTPIPISSKVVIAENQHYKIPRSQTFTTTSLPTGNYTLKVVFIDPEVIPTPPPPAPTPPPSNTLNAAINYLEFVPTNATPTPPPATPTLPVAGDADLDRDVDHLDLLTLLKDFGRSLTTQIDWNRNGTVDVFDFNVVVTKLL